jgi:hypothetical protein
MLCRTTSNMEPCDNGVKSAASERPLTPSWPTNTNASLCSGRIKL